MDSIFSALWARYVPEALVKIIMIALLLMWVMFQLTLYHWYFNKVQWFLETSLYAVYLVAYIRRPPARDRATHFHDVIIPFLGASVPFLFLLSPVSTSREMFPVVLWLLTGCVALVVLSALSLGKSFSITVEARQIQRRGMYKIIRHPMYASQILSALVMCLLLRYSLINIVLLVCFILIQVMRAKMEEEKLLKCFPEEYKEYQKKTKMFIPFIW